MNKIHSGVLALVLGIFFIHAADPPFEKNTGSFLEYTSAKYLPFTSTGYQTDSTLLAPRIDSQPDLQLSTSKSSQVENTENLQQFHNYLIKIHNETKFNGDTTETPEEKNYDVINKFLNKKEKTQYEKLLEKDFIRPLLTLYQKQIHQEPDFIAGNFSDSSRISKEDYVDDFKVLSKDELDMLIHGGETYQHNEEQNVNHNFDQKVRRDDNIEDNNDNEHIGEILPPDYKEEPKKENIHRFSPVRRRLTLYNPYRQRKSYDYEDGFKPGGPFLDNVDLPRLRKPVTFPGERFRPEYEPSASSGDGFDPTGEEPRSVFSRPPRLSLPPNEVPGFRMPRRFRGYPSFSDGFPTGRDQFFDPARYQSGWSGSRRPRVIFPTDLVAFRDPVQTQEESDWLQGDNSLQDLQDTDTRDRG